MAIQIIPASEQDAEGLARMVVLCNADDKIFNHIVARERNATPAQKAEHIRWRSERNRWNMQKKGTHYFKAIDTLTNRPVGFAGIASPDNDKTPWPGVLSDTVHDGYFMEYVQAVSQKRKELLGEGDDVWRKLYLELRRKSLNVRLTDYRCAGHDRASRVSRPWHRKQTARRDLCIAEQSWSGSVFGIQSRWNEVIYECRVQGY